MMRLETHEHSPYSISFRQLASGKKMIVNVFKEVHKIFQYCFSAAQKDVKRTYTWIKR